jgi:hypothetical protein
VGVVEMINIPFTADQVRQAWEEEANRLEGMNLMRESTAMRMSTISLEDQTIVFTHPSVAHQQELQRIINKLRPVLVKALNNNAFTFDYRIEETQHNDQGKLYTDNDKLTYLLNTYPELQAWRQDLGLDLI